VEFVVFIGICVHLAALIGIGVALISPWKVVQLARDPDASIWRKILAKQVEHDAFHGLQPADGDSPETVAAIKKFQRLRQYWLRTVLGLVILVGVLITMIALR
jgi:hypothetical protein